MHGTAMSIVLATPAVPQHHRWSPLPAFCWAFFAAGAAHAAEIWVITDRQHPVAAAPSIRVIELDAPVRIETELNAQLPTDPVRATAIVQQRLSYVVYGEPNIDRALERVEAYQSARP